MSSFRPFLSAVFALALVGCGGEAPPIMEGPPDEDGDGYARDVDCDDDDPTVNPGSYEDCNHRDDDCDDEIDEGFDADGDGWSQCQGECNDNDPTIYPGAPELCDGIESDCDPLTRDDADDDADGYTVCDGDCNDYEYLINPGAVEVKFRVLPDGTEEPEQVDNDCDGLIDEDPEPCDVGLSPFDPFSYAKAIELCNWVSSATFNVGSDGRSRTIAEDYGVAYVPTFGSSFAVLSSGIAADVDTPGYVPPQSGTAFSNSAPHPDPQPDPADGCGMADPPTVNDYVELALEIEVPTNALSFSFDFNFMSTEYPEYVCTTFDDTFIVYLESGAFTGNISFDSMGRPVTINIAFFTVCDPSTGSTCTGSAPLQGTGYEIDGGGTGWLTTTAPVVPGERARLRFIVFDEGDHILDSAVLIDNFRWDARAVDEPSTIP